MVHICEKGDDAVELDVSAHDDVFAFAAFEFQSCEVAFQLDAVDQATRQSGQKGQCGQDGEDYSYTALEGNMGAIKGKGIFGFSY